ncbi:MAG TPA: hypothetical protein DCP06_01560 [Lachnospiraceae bacterium]|nr:hypothetical protein [Lachnospiraceae bacterium]
MKILLMKTIPETIRKSCGTYILLMILVTAGMYIASAFAGVTYSSGIAYEEVTRTSNIEDGQFQVLTPLDAGSEQKLLDAGFTIEHTFYYDLQMDDGSVLRVMKTRQDIDKIILDEGELAVNDYDAVMDNCYAYHHGIKVSDTISCAGKAFHVTGIGSVADYNSPSKGMDDYGSDSEAFGIIFVSPATYQSFLEELGNNTNEMYVYAYKLCDGCSDDDIRAFLVNDLGEGDNLVTFVPDENNNRIGASQTDNEAYGLVGAVTGIGLLVMISLIFYLRLRFTLDKDSPSIGALLAMGVTKSDIYPMILVPFAITGFLGGLIGFLLSIFFDLESIATSKGYYCIPETAMRTNIWIFLYCVLMPPLICTLINMLLIRKKFSMPVISLINPSNDTRVFSKKWIVTAMLVGTLLTSFIFMTGRGVGLYCSTIKERLPEEIKYQYVYELTRDTKDVPEGALGTYRHFFSLEDHGYIRNIQFIGIEKAHPFFDVDPEKLNGGIAISSAVASRYGLGIGDVFKVFDPITGQKYEMNISDITDYSVMLTVFMNISDLMGLLGKDGIGFNMIYSDERLDYTQDMLFGSATKDELISPVEQLEPEVESSRDMFYILAIAFYAIMMIYLIQFTIVLSQRDIAILSAFGYSSPELARMFIIKLVAFSFLAVIIVLPLGYLFSKMMMPELIASTPIGIMIDYHLTEYLLHLSAAAFIIILSVIPGLRRIRNIDSLYYLRSRE